MVAVPNVLAPLLLQAVRDAVLFHEGHLRSETIPKHEQADAPEHHLHLTLLLSYLKEQYMDIEKDVGVPLSDLQV